MVHLAAGAPHFFNIQNMRKRVTYEIHGQVERNSFFRVGKALIRVEFTGGMVNSTGVYPAQYTTDNPLYQKAIEDSNAFRSGEIKMGRVEEFADDVPVAVAGSASDGEPTVPFTDVVNLQQARAVLMAEPYCCNLSELQNKAAVKSIAEQKGVAFPNWL